MYNSIDHVVACGFMAYVLSHPKCQQESHYRPYSIRIISALEALQHPLFTMVIHPLDAILSS